jgi:hypothetical protein
MLTHTALSIKDVVDIKGDNAAIGMRTILERIDFNFE